MSPIFQGLFLLFLACLSKDWLDQMSPPHCVQAPMPPSGQGLGLSSLPPASARRRKQTELCFWQHPRHALPIVPPNSTWTPLHGWRLTGSKTCPTSRRALLCCLLLHLAAGSTTFPLKCSAPRSPASFLPPGGTVIKLLQRDTHEEHDLRPGYLRQSPAAVGLGCVGLGGRSQSLRLTVSRARPAGEGRVLTWLLSGRLPSSECRQDSPNAGPPLGPVPSQACLCSLPLQPTRPPGTSSHSV